MQPVSGSSQILLSFGLTLGISAFFIGAIVAVVFIILERMKKKSRMKRSLSLVCLSVAVPRGNEIKVEAAEQMFAGLYGIFRRGISSLFSDQEVLSFEIVSKQRDIRFYVVIPDYLKDWVEKQIHSTYSEAEVEVVKEQNIFSRQGKIAYASLKLSNKPYFPIKRFKDLPTDSLNGTTSAMSKLVEGEAAVVQILISPTSDTWRGKGKTYAVTAKYQDSQQGQQGADFPIKMPKSSIDTSLTQGVEEKVAKVGFNTAIRIVCVGKDSQSANAVLDNIIGAFEQFRLPSYNGFIRRKLYSFSKKMILEGFIYRFFTFIEKNAILNSEELATIFHFPNKDVLTPNINWLLSKKAAPPSLLPESGLYLGKSVFRGVEQKIFLSDDDRRRHMYIVGQTGVGKSEFLKCMAVQDILAGHGIAFIDPHGDAVEDILTKIPPERAEDVIYFNPGDTARPMGLNILEAKTEEQQHMVINSFIGLLYKLYDPNHSGIMGPQLERAIRNIMLTAMAEEGNSLIEVLRLLTSPEFAKEKVALVKDPLVKRYWTDELAQTSDFHKSEKLGYFVSKFDRFVTDKLMRNIVGQSYSAFDFRKIMDERKIFLVNLSKGLIGEENSNFLGLILVPRLLVAAMGRVDVPEAQRPDFFFYVDEFQNFATPDFAQILSEARKYHLCLCVANQFIAQMEEHVKDAVFGNVGTLATFRIGVNDAEFLQNQFDPVFTKTDLINIPVGNVFARMLIFGAPSSPFSLAVDWKYITATTKNPEVAEMIKQLSRLKYGRDRDVVEAEIKMRAKLE